MKKTLKIVLLVIALLMLLGVTTNAADATATLTSSSTNIKPGDTIEAILAVSCEDGINGISTSITYDEAKLEKVSLEIVDSAKFANFGSDNSIEVISRADTKLTSENIVKITFKVKNDVQPGEEIVIGTSNITLDTDAATDSTKTIGAKQCKLKVAVDNSENEDPETPILTKIEITKEPTKTSYKVGEKADLSGIEITATYSDGTTKVITGYTYTPTGDLTADDKTVTVYYTENSITKTVEQSIEVSNVSTNDDPTDQKDQQTKPTDTTPKTTNTTKITTNSTAADKELPKTGLEVTVAIIILVLAVFATVGYIQYKKYKNV